MSAELPHLTPRERSVIAAHTLGLSTLEVAAQLGLSQKTVKFCLHIVYQKAGVKNGVGLAVWAVVNALADPSVQLQVEKQRC